MHDVGCVLYHVEREDGFCLLVDHVYVVCVVVDGLENCVYVVDVVDVVVIVIFMRVAEAVVPLCTNCSVNDA